ncbi:uncharacterized protein LOC128930046 [Callithrix jacchus]|uniref:uncharacterized protein LOC128930046 n=1 Tax=Callithrix jacchus TaxID=9483 RepID=UPI0023DD3E2F|nr:uncharacterized protein LOC128930046 [Callithrix jacchus]
MERGEKPFKEFLISTGMAGDNGLNSDFASNAMVNLGYGCSVRSYHRQLGLSGHCPFLVLSHLQGPPTPACPQFELSWPAPASPHSSPRRLLSAQPDSRPHCAFFLRWPRTWYKAATSELPKGLQTSTAVSEPSPRIRVRSAPEPPSEALRLPVERLRSGKAFVAAESSAPGAAAALIKSGPLRPRRSYRQSAIPWGNRSHSVESTHSAALGRDKAARLQARSQPLKRYGQASGAERRDCAPRPDSIPASLCEPGEVRPFSLALGLGSGDRTTVQLQKGGTHTCGSRLLSEYQRLLENQRQHYLG